MRLKNNFYNYHRRKILLLIIFFSMAFTPLLSLSEKDIILYFVKYRNNVADVFFNITTNLGGGLMACIFIAGIFFTNDFYKIKNANKVVIFSFVVTSIIIYSLKYIVNSPRPYSVIDLSNVLNTDCTSNVYNFHESFPSGHSGTAFMIACATSIVFRVKRKRFFLLLIIIASLVSCSRLYLLRHFYSDIYFGALIGSFCTFITSWVINEKYD